jgi:hypothetical protein
MFDIATRQKPDRLKMPRQGGVATRHIPIFQIVHAKFS